MTDELLKRMTLLSDQLLIGELSKIICRNIHSIFSAKTTYFTFSLQKEIEFERLHEEEERVLKIIKEKFPFCWFCVRGGYSPLFSVFNSANCFMAHISESFDSECFLYYPKDMKYFLKGWSPVITRDELATELKHSKDYIINGISSLERRGIVVKKRSVGGFMYMVNHQIFIDSLLKIKEDGFNKNFYMYDGRGGLEKMKNSSMLEESYSGNKEKIENYFKKELNDFIQILKMTLRE